MSIHESVKRMIREHKSKIEFFQQAVISSVASLVYSNYISLIRHVNSPMGQITKVPAIQTVKHVLDPEGDFMEILSAMLIDGIVDDPKYKEFASIPEFKLFEPDQIEILKTIFDLYVIPNIGNVIASVISRKFRLDEPVHTPFREDPQVPILWNDPTNMDIYRYIRDETILQMLGTAPVGVMRETSDSDGNMDIPMASKEILVIDNSQMLSPIYINKDIINNTLIMKLLTFVLSIQVTEVDTSGDVAEAKGPNSDMVLWRVNTHPFNRTRFVRVALNTWNTEPVDFEQFAADRKSVDPNTINHDIPVVI